MAKWSTIMQRHSGKPTTLAPLTPGKILVGRYRVQRPIGRGAMGEVYEVERTSDGKRFAAKLLSTRADKASLLRFTREAQIMARVSHPNLIGIADIDMTAGGVLFIVLELVGGGSLLQLRHRYGDARWAMCVLRQISDALAAIHQAGIVHRDLKPGNVLIAGSREAELPLIKLADFGVSLLTGEGSGPIALLARKPSGASLRGGMGASSMSIPPPPPSDPGVPRRPEPPEELSDDAIGLPQAPDMYTASDEDEDADTNSIMKLDDSELGTASLMISDLKTEGPGELTAQPTPPAVPVVSVNLAAHPSRLRAPASRPPPMPRTMEMEAPKLPDTSTESEPAEFKVLRPSQASVSAMLAAAPDDSVVVSGMLTQADALIGTPMYMAPELCNTGSHRAEPLSDIFSVGVIAFELLTGRMPFAVPPVISQANDEPIFIMRLAQVRPDLDPRLIALVESCLALNPGSRLRAAELTRRLIEIGAPAPPV